MILTELRLEPAAFAARTGWELKPEGACKGELCVPLRDEERDDLEALAARLGMPLVRHREGDLWAVGPETATTGKALTTAEAPDLVLPDFDGNPFALRDLRGQKVLLAAWASW